MTTVRASGSVAGPITEVEALWYDPARRAGWVPGFAALVSCDSFWPAAGGRLVWDAKPGGRGRVVERVTDYLPGGGQDAEVEDERLEGAQAVRFTPAGAGEVDVSLSLDYRLKERSPMTPLVDLFYVSRTLGAELDRTLLRFAAERSTDADLLPTN